MASTRCRPGHVVASPWGRRSGLLLGLLFALRAAAATADAPVAPAPSVPSASAPGAIAGPAPTAPAVPRAREPRAYAVDVHAFHLLERESGPVNYYKTVDDPQLPFIRGVYRPGLETSTLFYQVPDDLRRGVRRIRWSWRAVVLPRGGNECVGPRADSAANFYLTWKRGLRWYSLKFVWSTEGKQGETCAGKRNPLVAQDSIVARSGGPTSVWRDEEVDPDALFRAHFEDGDPNAEVPDFAGLGILVDGDQTQSVSAGDFARVVLLK